MPLFEPQSIEVEPTIQSSIDKWMLAEAADHFERHLEAQITVHGSNAILHAIKTPMEPNRAFPSTSHLEEAQKLTTFLETFREYRKGGKFITLI